MISGGGRKRKGGKVGGLREGIENIDVKEIQRAKEVKWKRKGGGSTESVKNK
jgi:hypothetical protein